MAFRDPFLSRVKRKAEDMVSSESDGSASGEGSEAGEEASETANEKRVRLARAMIETVRGDSDDPDEEENVSKRLQKLAAGGQGGRGLFVALGAALAATPCEWGPVRDSLELRGHAHVPTCVALQGDLVASGAKGGRLLVHRCDGTLLFEAAGDGKNDVKALCWAGPGHLAVARRGAAAVQLWRTEGPGAGTAPEGLFQCGVGGASALCADGTQLYAAGEDGTLRAFDIRSRVELGVHFGHQQRATAAVLVGRDRVLTCSEDKTVRLWRLEQSQQAVFRGPKSSIDCVVAQVKGAATLGAFCSGQQDGSLSLWSASKRKALCSVAAAHGGRWIGALAHLKHSDLLASGSHDGFVRLWRFSADLSHLEAVAAIPAPGFVTALALEAEGALEGPVVAARLLVALGREHRLGRWWSTRRDAETLGAAVCEGATDSVFCYPLLLPNPDVTPQEEEEEEEEEVVQEQVDDA